MIMIMIMKFIKLLLLTFIGLIVFDFIRSMIKGER